MGNFNKVMILGRLTRDPEVRYTPSSTPVCDISLAVGRRVGGGDTGTEAREETTYVDVTLWRRQAELAGQYLAKGRELFVEGRLEMDSWEDRNTGQKRTKLKVVCDNMQFVGGGGGGGGGQQRPPQQQPQQSYQQPAYQQAAPAAQAAPSPPPQQSAPQAAPPQFENDGYTAPAPAPQAAAPYEPEGDDEIPF